MIKNMFLALVAALACAGCANTSAISQVTFEYFNLSTNEIWVTEVSGLPPGATPGRLMPSRGENPLEVTASVFSRAIHIKSNIKIVWKDGGKEGWPGGLKSGELVPAGVAHAVPFKRDQLGLPRKI